MFNCHLSFSDAPSARHLKQQAARSTHIHGAEDGRSRTNAARKRDDCGQMKGRLTECAQEFAGKYTRSRSELPSWYRRGGAKPGWSQRIAFCERPPRPLLIKGCFAAFSLGRIHPSCSRRGAPLDVAWISLNLPAFCASVEQQPPAAISSRRRPFRNAAFWALDFDIPQPLQNVLGRWRRVGKECRKVHFAITISDTNRGSM